MVDKQGRYHLDLNRRFPFAAKLYSFPPGHDRYPLNWHERLEIFVPVAGSGQFRMGERLVDFAPGDVLVVDNLKLHGLASFQGRECKAVDLLFTSDLIYTLGSPVCDFVYLIPFYCQMDEVAPVLRAGEPRSAAVHAALAALLECYAYAADGRPDEAGCKAYLIQILYQLSKHLGNSEVARSEYLRQQERARTLGRLIDYVNHHFAEKINVADAAAVVNMSQSRFMRFFRHATGTTFVAYLTQVRLVEACRLLTETTLPITEIAGRTGFSDECYFDRKFKQHFQSSPRQIRLQKR